MKNNQHLEGTILHLLKKEKARKEIHFVTDFSMDPNGWFISVKTIQSGKVTSASCIIKKDLEQWLDSYRREGWVSVLKTNNFI